ncbi:hypothetical protein EUTSA_v10027593mg [Eutrema salsugineum]|uniref:Uncharacterized protein n=2 Tax=Eutrema salsugineum TaxID=72664 RepID=V4LSM8_EUTSA|nr:hypothetical protein EUTSA_v10027593mg [Eutrema salsugineum]
MYRVSSPQELLAQLFSLRNRSISPDREAESSSSTGRELLDLILTFNDESDDENASDDEDGISREDFFS